MIQNNLTSIVKVKSKTLLSLTNKVSDIFSSFIFEEIGEDYLSRIHFKNKFDGKYRELDELLSNIILELENIRNQCYNDLEQYIDILKLNTIPRSEAMEIIKKSREAILLLDDLRLKNGFAIKKSLIDNENMRFFIHQVMNTLSIAKPFFTKKILDKELESGKIIKESNFIKEKLQLNFDQIKRFQTELKSLVNMNNNIILKGEVSSKDIVYYIKMYIENRENRNQNIEFDFYFEEYFDFSGNLFKIQEVIDVILNNACEELVNKDLELEEEFLKEIKISVNKNNSHLIIDIKDSGRGIPDIKAIFQPYFTTKASSGGSGIGLSAAQTIIQLLNGYLTVQTEKDTGSLFSVNIPLK